MATMTKTYQNMEQLVYAALDVAVPLERYRYLRGFIDGYQAREKLETIEFDLSKDEEEKS